MAATRKLWWMFAVCLALSVAGGIVLFNPSLSFFAVDVMERMHVPVRSAANIAVYAEALVFAVGAFGLLTLTVRRFLQRR